MMPMTPAQTVPSIVDDHGGIKKKYNRYSLGDDGPCPVCLDPAGLCDCEWRIMQLDASYSIYAALNEDAGKPTATPVPSSAAGPPDSLPYYTTNLLELDGLNCGGIPTRTTPTLTPTTLRNIEADIANLTPSTSEDFAAAAASDLHHLVSATCSSINVSTPENIDRLNSDLLDRHNLQSFQQINIQNMNTQNIIINNLPNHQQMNQNTLNQQQRNDYNNSFSVAPSRQAGFVPPLVLQINSSNGIAQQPSGTTVLLNSNNSSVFGTKGVPTSTSTSHWQGAVVTQQPQQLMNSTIKRQYTDDEDGDEDFDSDITDDSSDTTSAKMTRKSNAKNKSSSKTNIKNEFKNTTNTSNSGGRGRSNKNNKVMSAEEEQRRQIRRERNKMAAARCRKRRMDHTNELLEETEQLEEKRLRLQLEMESLNQQKNNLQQMLAQHKCILNMKNRLVSNAVTSVNHAATVLDSNSISESNTSVLTNESSSANRNVQQQNIAIKTDNDSVDNILIKCEDPVMSIKEDNKDDIDIIPTSVMQQTSRRRPTTLLQLNSGNYGNCNKKVSGNDSSNVVVLNFDSLMDGGTGLTPISGSVGSVQSQQQQHSSTNSNGNNVLS